MENDSFPANSNALLQVDSYGCQVNAVAPDATAIPQRSSILKLQYQISWTDPAQDGGNLGWIRGFYDETFDGCYINYPVSDLIDWQYLYYKENYQRLQRVKQVWDRRNIVHHQQSIVGGQ